MSIAEISQITVSKDKIFDLLKESKINEVMDYIKDNKLSMVDCVDEHGTTPLQYAVLFKFENQKKN